MSVVQTGTRRDRLRRLIPFTLIAFAPMVLASISLEHSWALLVAGGLTAAVVVAVVVLPWERLPSYTRIVPVILYCGAVAFARHAQGGGSSSLTLLLLLPVLYLALYGDRTDVYAAIAATAGALVVPVVLLGGPEYPVSQWQGVAVWLIVAPVAGCLVHSLLDHVRTSEATMMRIAHVAQGLTTAGDNREAICRVAIEVTGADLAYLIEPKSDDRLMSTAVAGVLVPPFEIKVDEEPSGAVNVCRSGQPLFVADVFSAAVSQRIARLTGVRSAYYQPVLRGGEAIGVMVLGWREPTPSVPAGLTASMALIAAEAAMAMERTDQLSAATRLARVDPLTGLPNRRSWDEEAGRAVANRRRGSEPLSVALVDIDHFKELNDTKGHQAGDRFLKEASAAWRTSLREGDLIARWGGEEFAVLLPRCTGVRGVEVLERLRQATPPGRRCSAGIAEVRAEDTLDTAIERADAALYAAKAAGRNRSHLYDAEVLPPSTHGHGGALPVT